LPDGTAVWLNHGSKLIYPNRFAGKFRTVKLVGEGYFDVSHNKQMPFIVEAKGMEIKALGTSFNIKAFDGSDFETTLESGKVVVSKEDTGNGDKICEMVPGEHFTFNTSTNKFILRKENLLKYVSWKDGKLVFIDDPIDRVIDRLGHWYNVKITLKDQDLKPLTYTATFVDETLDQVLEMMADISPISYTVINRSKLKDGTFSEKEILIFKKGGLSE
jgi:ferric-dicitrate binding protein FerR (iron transport regulator)